MLTESHVRTAVALWLRRIGYGIQDPKEKGQHGPDIRARHKNYARYFIVEAKGDPSRAAKHPDSQRTVNFWVAIGQIATRMDNDGLYHYGIAFPATFKRKVKNLPWQFAKKNRLSVFFVDAKRKVTRLTWKELKKPS